MLTFIATYLPNAMFQDTNIIDGVTLLMLCLGGITSGLIAREHRDNPAVEFKSRTDVGTRSVIKAHPTPSVSA